MKSCNLVVCLVVCLMLTACKLVLEPTPGGSVVSESGSIWCDGGATCEIPVTDTEFSETFIAEAAPGFYFRRWRGGKNTLCALSVDECALSTQHFGSNDFLMSILGSDEKFYLWPVFSRGDCIDISGKVSPVDFPLTYVREGQACPDAAGVPRVHGQLKLWEDGKLVSLTRWDLGLRQGNATLWWPNGKLRATGNWLQGKIDGRQRDYYKDGSLKHYSSYDNGIRQGPFADFTRLGEVKSEGVNSPLLKLKNRDIVRDLAQGIVWLRDGNIFKTLCDAGSEISKGFQPVYAASAEEICADNGAMTWFDANLWVEYLNELNYAGYNTWRLPEVDTDPLCSEGSCTNNEMGALYYNGLNNIDGDLPTFESTCFLWTGYYAAEFHCLLNLGPFTNIQRAPYWLGTQHPVWLDYYFFMFSFGGLDSDNPENLFHVWPIASA